MHSHLIPHNTIFSFNLCSQECCFFVEPSSSLWLGLLFFWNFLACFEICPSALRHDNTQYYIWLEFVISRMLKSFCGTCIKPLAWALIFLRF